MCNTWVLKPEGKVPVPALQIAHPLILAYPNLQVKNYYRFSCCNIAMDECVNLKKQQIMPIKSKLPE
jgi:hypothetical protein